MVLNPVNLRIKSNSITFFGCTYNSCAIHLNTTKVNAIHAMSSLQSIIQLQMFLGMVIFLTPFIPSISSDTLVLHQLLWTDIEFHLWNAAYQATFKSIKVLVSTNTKMHYFMFARWWARLLCPNVAWHCPCAG